MTNSSAVAKNYAKALFNAAEKNNAVDNVGQDFARFVGVFDDKFASELKNPAISKKDSLKIAAELCKKLGFTGIFADFLTLMFDVWICFFSAFKRFFPSFS